MSNFRLTINSLRLLVSLAVFLTVSAYASISNAGNWSIIDRVTALERITNNQAQLLQQIQQQLNASQSDIDSLRNSIQQNSYQLNQAVERQKQLYLQLDTITSKDKTAAIPSPTPKQTTAPATATEKSGSMLNPAPEAAATDGKKNDAASATQGDAANKEYNAAIDLILASKQYDKAIVALQAWIKRYPQSTYQPNANYWLGQLYYSKKQPDQASYYFATVVKDYPSSPKASEALLKVGEILQKQKQDDKAQEVFQQVIARYPNTPSAKTAKTRLSGKQPVTVLNLLD